MESKSEKIRQALAEGKAPKEVAAALKVPVNTVYTVRWKATRNTKAKKRGRPAKAIVRVQAPIPAAPKKATPVSDLIREELHSIETQIDRLQTIASYLAIRLRQSEQNGD